jgi:hypothetical protein
MCQTRNPEAPAVFHIAFPLCSCDTHLPSFRTPLRNVTRRSDAPSLRKPWQSSLAPVLLRVTMKCLARLVLGTARELQSEQDLGHVISAPQFAGLSHFWIQTSNRDRAPVEPLRPSPHRQPQARTVSHVPSSGDNIGGRAAAGTRASTTRDPAREHQRVRAEAEWTKRNYEQRMQLRELLTDPGLGC